MAEEKNLIYKIDPRIIEDGMIMSVSKAEELVGSKLVGRYGNRGVATDIIPGAELYPDTKSPKAEILFSPISIYNRFGDELEVTTKLLGNKPGYQRVNYIDVRYFRRMFYGVEVITRKTANTRKDRRIMRRAKQALGLKRVDKVLYVTWRSPRAYLVEGKGNEFTLPEKGTREREIFNTYLGKMGMKLATE